MADDGAPGPANGNHGAGGGAARRERPSVIAARQAREAAGWTVGHGGGGESFGASFRIAADRAASSATYLASSLVASDAMTSMGRSFRVAASYVSGKSGRSSREADAPRTISGRLGVRDSPRPGRRPVRSGRRRGEAPRPGEGTPLVVTPEDPEGGADAKDGDDGEGEGEGRPPPLAAWIVPALGCALAYAFYNIFIKKGSASIHPILGGVILQFVAALLGTALLAGLVLGGDKNFELHHDRDGVLWSVCAGLAVGLAEMLSFCVSGLGVPATQSIPIIIGGSVMFGAVLGLIMLGEQLMLHGWSGVALLVTGIAFVALDPGEKVEEGGGREGTASEVGEGGGPPAYWIAVALVCASAYAFYNIFIKRGSASINPILGGVILQFVAAIFGSVLLLTNVIKDRGTSGLDFDRAGFVWSCAAGLAVGAAEMLSFCVSGMGVNATQSIPIIIGGSVLFGAVLGLVMLGETMMWPGWAGVALLTTGIGMVATDPGEKVEGH